MYALTQQSTLPVSVRSALFKKNRNVADSVYPHARRTIEMDSAESKNQTLQVRDLLCLDFLSPSERIKKNYIAAYGRIHTRIRVFFQHTPFFLLLWDGMCLGIDEPRIPQKNAASPFTARRR